MLNETTTNENIVNDLSSWYETPNSEAAVKHMEASNIVLFATGLWS